jgi:small-conductance mechanosensitive channel
VLPYGEIKRLRNTSRDWMIMKMEFRLTYDTDLKKVKQIVKKIGKEISEDAELSKHLIEPLKSQGVTAAEDSALIVRVKYMADPASGGAFTIRREAYAKIIAAFTAAGIKFANRQVTVISAADAAAAGAAAAAAADPGKA